MAKAFLVAVLLCSTQSRAAEIEVIASGLNNPRGLDFAPNGALYIVESGKGGDGPEVVGPEGPVRFGLSGSITRIFRGTQERIVTGLPSLGGEGGAAAYGPSGISFGQFGHALVTIGLAFPPSVRDTVLGPQAANLGTLHQLSAGGNMQLVADLAAFEGAEDPDQNGPDSNPNGVLAVSGGQAYVTDAGGNTLLRVDANGAISVAAVFPNRMVNAPPNLPPGQIPMQPVPTNVVRGPNDALFVSELTGFPFPLGGARVYQIGRGTEPMVYAGGFTNIIDLEFDRHGNLYVLEIDTNGLLTPEPIGRLARFHADGRGTKTITTTGLVAPGGMVIGPDGAIYITNYSVSAGEGQVVRIRP